MISNPYANLGVATQASKFEAEQIDMSLANTLDTLKETGASAGGATALAQAALKSKQGISANIEQQEASNEKLRAQGEQQMEQMQMAEAQRIQGVQISEGQRMQQAGAAGKQFVFGATEAREQQKIERVAGQLSGAAFLADPIPIIPPIILDPAEIHPATTIDIGYSFKNLYSSYSLYEEHVNISSNLSVSVIFSGLGYTLTNITSDTACNTLFVPSGALT